MSEATIPDNIPLDKALTNVHNEVVRDRTLELIAKQLDSASPRDVNFRGDVAEKYGYDKVKLRSAGRAFGNVVVVRGESVKTGKQAFYQMQVNQWGLLEALALLAE